MHNATLLNTSTTSGPVGVSWLALEDFLATIDAQFNAAETQCLTWYAYPTGTRGLNMICVLLDVQAKKVMTYGTQVEREQMLPSLTARHLALQGFEREMAENFGLKFEGHPWPKPVRFPHDRHPTSLAMDDYPFFHLKGGQTHEVGVGPIHAGVIEPGHFRFSCTGEYVEHLEVQLGYQHRGVEYMMVNKPDLLSRTLIAENIAGDTTVGHTVSFVKTIEQLAGIEIPMALEVERTIALEIERIAMYTFDLSNLSVGVSYQLGLAAIGALRTPVINYFQWWCGNRFAKSLIRVGGTHFPMTEALSTRLTALLDDYEPRFKAITDEMFGLNSFLARTEGVGIVTHAQARRIGAVGYAAKNSGVARDLRQSQPGRVYDQFDHQPCLFHTGDVYARAEVRRQEVLQSIGYLRKLLAMRAALPADVPSPQTKPSFAPNQFAIGMCEAWRGECIHSAVTDASGNIIHYKVKDPSFHNWLGLGLALRGNEISDFPINNKTFDQSYCGHDL